MKSSHEKLLLAVEELTFEEIVALEEEAAAKDLVTPSLVTTGSTEPTHSLTTAPQPKTWMFQANWPSKR